MTTQKRNDTRLKIELEPHERFILDELARRSQSPKAKVIRRLIEFAGAEMGIGFPKDVRPEVTISPSDKPAKRITRAQYIGIKIP